MNDKDNYEEIVVTLYEGHYHYGVAALANSLAKARFRGLVNVGYRGNLPPWFKLLKSVDSHTLILTEDIIISFEKIDTPLHFGYYKPFFLLKTLENYPLVKKIYYFDPDVVVNSLWSFFSKWLESGISLCLDNSFAFIHRNHPWRTDWKKLATSKYCLYNDVDYYVNSGFIGLKRDDKEVLNRWIYLTQQYIQAGGNIKLFEKSSDRSFKGDQDFLNATITISPDFEFSIIGQEGMGFVHPAYLMTHTVSVGGKPWNKGFIKQALIYGQKPDLPEKNYFNFCEYPIKIFPKSVLLRRKASLKIASVIGRLIG